VGSTTRFTQRKSLHKHRCNSTDNYNHKIYQTIRQNGGWDNWDMVMVEEFSCENKLQLHARERQIIESLNSNLNAQIPSQTLQEYKIKNADALKEKKNAKCICPCGGRYSRVNKSHHEKSIMHHKFMNQKQAPDEDEDFTMENMISIKDLPDQDEDEITVEDIPITEEHYNYDHDHEHQYESEPEDEPDKTPKDRYLDHINELNNRFKVCLDLVESL
jgi:hypothetical protein